MERKKGFTLLELLIVVIVIAILATFAVPQFTRALERTRVGKARHHLGIISQALKMCRALGDQYPQVTGTIAEVDCPNTGEKLGDFVELDEIDNDVDWDYTSEGEDTSGTGFTLVATRQRGPHGASEGVDGATVTLQQDGTWGGDHPLAGVPE